MINKTFSGLFNFAKQEKAERIVISRSEKGHSCHCHLPGGEEAIFNLPKKLENDLAENLRALLKIAPGELATEKYCQWRDKNNDLNFRLSIVPDKLGEKIIISIIQEDKKFLSLNQLGWQKNDLELLNNINLSGSGLIIISSPERQGRSTTLQAILNDLNQENKNIYFLGAEEFNIQGVNFLKNTPENWSRILNHDSDIIALEIEENDQESLKRAIMAAHTGRLVLVTIKSINSLQALYQILRSGLSLKLILDNLKMISGQELIPLKRMAFKDKKKRSRQRQQIGVFETFIPRPETIGFIKENYKHLTTAKFWEDFFRLAHKNGYRPLIVDKNQKKKDGLV
ncbi:MAG: Flp pilus assembly complex ATPase component TadA [Candidatus Falkowbacteria bacterium]|nr:MAG: Flp pilus assembly complex ATPase component TadA [Candidatus Falkowbacteria bacterium]